MVKGKYQKDFSLCHLLKSVLRETDTKIFTQGPLTSFQLHLTVFMRRDTALLSFYELNTDVIQTKYKTKYLWSHDNHGDYNLGLCSKILFGFG